MPASMSAASCGVSGCRKSTPETSPKKCLCNWRMATGMNVSLIAASGCSALFDQKITPCDGRVNRPGASCRHVAGHASEERRCYFPDFVPGIGDVDGTGLAELELVALPDVRGGAQAYGRHAGSHGGPDAARAVFDDEA